MEWLSVVFKSLIVVIIFSARTTSSMTVNYVKPLNFESKTASPCSETQRPCLTLSEYTSDLDVYFINNTIFYFYPGMHTLRDSLVLENLHNLSFHGWPSGEKVVKIIPAIGPSAGISLTRSYDIKITSISFVLYDNFTFIMRFTHSQLVQMSDISIYGNGYSGCSSIISQGSELDISNASYFKIKGFFGAALMMLASNVTLRGSNVFVGNTAASGGSIYLSDSNLLLSGASLFLNNTSLRYSKEVVSKTLLLCNYQVKRKVITIGTHCGGAISCFNSFLKLHGHSNFSANIAYSAGGALLVHASKLFIQGFTFFGWNVASDTGGALTLFNASSNITGSLSLKRNEAKFGGGMEVRIGYLSIQGHALFDGNTGTHGGGALRLRGSHLEYCGVSFDNNMASYFPRGGANNSKAPFGYKCFTNNVVTVSFLSFISNVGGDIHSDSDRGSYGGAVRSYNSNIVFSGLVHFERNQGFRGGAMGFKGASKLILNPKLSVSFISNHAYRSGGALYFSDSQCSLGSTVPIECFIVIVSDGPLASISNVSLHFENNSAKSTGSILYGGQLDKCGPFFRKGTEASDQCSGSDYGDNAFQTFMSISTVIEHENSVLNISSPAKEIKDRCGYQSILKHILEESFTFI